VGWWAVWAQTGRCLSTTPSWTRVCAPPACRAPPSHAWAPARLRSSASRCWIRWSYVCVGSSRDKGGARVVWKKRVHPRRPPQRLAQVVPELLERMSFRVAGDCDRGSDDGRVAVLVESATSRGKAAAGASACDCVAPQPPPRYSQIVRYTVDEGVYRARQRPGIRRGGHRKDRRSMRGHPAC
jgi:hypothetical protein